MTDVYVHERMKECCRKTLKEIDERKKLGSFTTGILPVASLLTWLGENPIHIATTEITTRVASGGKTPDPVEIKGSAEAIVKETCAKICNYHGFDHDQKGEHTEAQFWFKMVLPLKLADTPPLKLGDGHGIVERARSWARWPSPGCAGVAAA